MMNSRIIFNGTKKTRVQVARKGIFIAEAVKLIAFCFAERFPFLVPILIRKIFD
jgi:hypothetical protein